MRDQVLEVMVEGIILAGNGTLLLPITTTLLLLDILDCLDSKLIAPFFPFF